jgi:hypothetical protein
VTNYYGFVQAFNFSSRLSSAITVVLVAFTVVLSWPFCVWSAGAMSSRASPIAAQWNAG